MTIIYPNGPVLEAILLSHEENQIRATAPGCDDVLLPNFRLAKNNRSKSACTLSKRKRLKNQAVWPVILRLTGPICARAPKLIDFRLG